MNRCSKKNVLLLLLVTTFCCAVQVFPQATSGTILGQVTDPQSKVIPNAAVTAKNDNTGLTQSTQTNANGEFSLLNLPPGSYTLTVTKDGFTKAVSSNKILQIDQKLRLDIQLSVGSVNETVNISSEPPLLQTESTETSQVVETKSISDLPLLGRNFLDLTRLSTGVANGEGGNTLNISVNGQREFANSVVVDGIEVTSNRNNDTGVSPSVDSVQEFKIQTSAYAPEYGRSSGAVVTIQTQSGTNSFHGSLYEFFRPSITSARPFFATARPGIQQHNFGGTVGGPIKKDKLFFFFSYEGIRSKNAFNYLDSVPPIGQIKFLDNGDVDLSGLIDPLTGTTIPIFDPLFLTTNYYVKQFPGNIIPADRVSAAGKAILLKLFPAATAVGTLNGWYSNYPVSQAYRYDSNRYQTKVDYNFSDTDRLTVAYHLTPFNYVTGDRFAGNIPIEGGGSTDSAEKSDTVNQSLSITETHLFSSGFVNEFRFGYSRFKLYQDDLIPTGSDIAAKIGLGNIYLSDFSQTDGLPYIQLGTGYSTGGSTYKPLSFLDSNFQVSDNVSKSIGSHSLKAGVNLRFLNAAPTFSLLPTGYMYFGGAYSSLTSDPNYCGLYCGAYGYYNPAAFFGNGGSDIADLLLGLPQIVQIGLQLTDPRTKSKEVGFYFQDNWQINRRLSFNYGLRYEYQSPYSEADNNLSNFDPETMTILLAGRGGNSETLINPDKNNLMPRFGLAFKLNDKTVLRGGYGVFYTPENDARSDVLTKNYPFATRQDYYNSTWSLTYNLDAGVPRTTAITIPDGASSISALSIPNAKNQAFYYVDPDFKTGYSQLFNIVLQRELFSNFTVEAGYVGSASRKLPYAIGNINRSGRISSSLGRIEGQFSVGEADYNSLQIKADKRFSKGYGFYAAYTYSKCMDNGPSPFNPVKVTRLRRMLTILKRKEQFAEMISDKILSEASFMNYRSEKENFF